MANIKLIDQATQQPLVFATPENDAVGIVIEEAAKWADTNGFSSLTLRLEGERKLIVQIDDEQPLHSWIDLDIFRQGRAADLEAQLDFARGEFRRRVVGYGKFDR
jgi:hypothetical protein